MQTNEKYTLNIYSCYHSRQSYRTLGHALNDDDDDADDDDRTLALIHSLTLGSIIRTATVFRLQSC